MYLSVCISMSVCVHMNMSVSVCVVYVCVYAMYVCGHIHVYIPTGKAEVNIGYLPLPLSRYFILFFETRSFTDSVT